MQSAKGRKPTQSTRERKPMQSARGSKPTQSARERKPHPQSQRQLTLQYGGFGVQMHGTDVGTWTRNSGAAQGCAAWGDSRELFGKRTKRIKEGQRV